MSEIGSLKDLYEVEDIGIRALRETGHRQL